MKRQHILSLILSLLMLVSFSVSAIAEVENSEAETSELQIDMNEGRRLWNEYIKQLEPYKDDETIYDEKITPVFQDRGEKIYSQLYGNKNEFIEMSQYEKLLWLPTLFPAYFCPKMSDSLDWNSWKTMISVLSNTFKKRFENTDLGFSYDELMKWQFDYYVEAKKIFNFVDEFGMEIKEPEELTSKEVTEEVSGEYVSQNIQLPSKAPTESVEEISTDVSEEKGIWDGAIDYVKTHVITLAILLILCIATAIVVIIRKKKNIDNK